MEEEIENVSEDNKNLKLKIFNDCLKLSERICRKFDCPIYDKEDSCTERFKRGEFNENNNCKLK